MKKVIPANSAKQLKLFVDFPHELYKQDSNYVPELFIAQRDLLTPGRHPFHENGEVQKFLAYDGEAIVGRIAAIINKSYDQFTHTNAGFFGFFECIDDSETAKLLFSAAEGWLREKGVTGKIIGPVNPSTNEVCALLIDGFDGPPKVMMPYNKSYYQKLIEENGYGKQTDILAYQFLRATYNDTRMRRLHDLMKKRLHERNIIIRKINLKDFKNEAARLKDVYNAAWDKNLGFVPMTDNEFNYAAKDMKLILDPEYCIVAEHEGKVVGFALALPNINEALIKVKRGRLFPTGIFKLLTGKKKVKSMRILLLGVIEGYRKAGIEMYFYSTFIDNVSKSKYINEVEASWILEDNLLMRKAIEDINGKVYRRYRIFEKQI